VATALSWIRGNIDLFNGDAREIVAVGYRAATARALPCCAAATASPPRLGSMAPAIVLLSRRCCW
jgi:carboxylesterase type B